MGHWQNGSEVERRKAALKYRKDIFRVKISHINIGF